MEHWLAKVIKILEADTADLRKLAQIAGGNPVTFYKHTRLSDLDIAGQDVSGMTFKGGAIQRLPSPEGGKRDYLAGHPTFTAEAEFGGQKRDMEDFEKAIRNLMSRRKYNDAQSVALEAIDFFPDEPTFLRMLATIYRRLSNTDALNNLLERAYRKFSNELWLTLQYALSKIFADQIEAAIHILIRALSYFTEPGAVLEILALLARADKAEGIAAYSNQLDFAKSKQFQSRLFVELADLCLQTRRDDEAVSYINSAIALFPVGARKSRFYEMLARAATIPELRQGILDMYLDFIRSGAKPPLNPFIDGLAKAGLIDQVAFILEEVGNSPDTNANYFRELADVYWRTGNRAASIELLRKHVQFRNPGFGTSRTLISRLLAVDNFPEALFEARTALQNGQQLTPRLLKEFLPFAERHVEVSELLEEALFGQPDSLAIVVLLARVHSLRGEGATATAFWHRAGTLSEISTPLPKWLRKLIAGDENAMRVHSLREAAGVHGLEKSKFG